MSVSLIAVIALLFYVASTGLLIVRLARLSLGGGKTLTLSLGFGALILHAVVLQQSMFIVNGLDLGFFNAASLVGWTAALLIMLAGIKRPVENLGIVLLPLAALTMMLEVWFSATNAEPLPASWQLQIHILISIIAYSVLTAALVQSVLLAIQDSHLRNRQPGGFVRAMPPLQSMESLLFQMIAVGFTLLSASLLTGILFLQDIFAQHLVHKTVLSIVSWMVFGILLWGRWRYGWRGRTAIRWTLSGFVFLMLAYFGTKLVLEMLLQP